MSIALFALVFSLTSALIAIFYQSEADQKLKSIDFLRDDQLSLRDAQEKIVEQIIQSRAIKDRYLGENKLVDNKSQSVCAAAYAPLLRSSYELNALINLALSVSTNDQAIRFDLKEKASRYSKYIAKTKEYHLKEICTSKTIAELAVENDQWTLDLQELLNLSTELKLLVSERMKSSVGELMAVYDRSRLAILIAFILQLIIFGMINYLDIKTFRLSSRQAR